VTVVTVATVDELGATASRREFLKLMGFGGALVLLPGLLTACQDSNDLTAPSVGNPVIIDFSRGDVAVLQLAFALEQLQAGFYTRVVDNLASLNASVTEQRVLGDVRNHEVIHRDFLKSVLGAEASFALQLTYPDVSFADRSSVLTAARTIEDLSVAAYAGAAQYLSDPSNLLVVAKIASVEARHAAAIRDLLSPRATDARGFAPTAFDDAFRPSKAVGAAQRYVVDLLSVANTPAFVQGPNGTG
jgi:hypothetical protein